MPSMTLDVIRPEQLPNWVPGAITHDSSALGWNGMSLRGYRYNPSDVAVPPIRDYMIVVYGRGATPMSRQCFSTWSNERVAPGNVSLLTHRIHSHWRWTREIEVTHLYLSPTQLARVANNVFERDIQDVELCDVLKADDPSLAEMVRNLAEEVQAPGVGGRLYADAIMNQACVHILRNYANVVFKQDTANGQLSGRQKRQLLEYMHAHIAANMLLEDLAQVAGLSVYHFARRFRASFGVPPHEFIINLRLEAAMRLLRSCDEALNAVAAHCGFSDQSHMTRLFRKRVSVTPGQYRNQHR